MFVFSTTYSFATNTLFIMHMLLSTNKQTIYTQYRNMRAIIMLLCIVIYFSGSVYSQNTHSIQGKITNEEGKTLSFAKIAIHELQQATMSNAKGYFSFQNIPNGKYHLHISYLGYDCIPYAPVQIQDDNFYAEYQMQANGLHLDEVVITGEYSQQRKRESSAGIEIIDKLFIDQNINSSLMKSLESLPGIASMEIGQGFAKPVIRGLSFNRVAVTDNGIKQEGQQWGADHGLEIDQMGVENIEIIKGPASLLYGSDAIGGVVQIQPNSIPEIHTSENELLFIGKSLNMLYGLSAMSKYRADFWHYYIRYTQTDFGDYKVPADSFYYNRYRLPITNKRLKNTAGKERNIAFSTGLITEKVKSTFNMSHVYSQMGFFPGSHGIPNAQNLNDDGNRRNIGLPFQKVRHTKIMNTTELLSENNSWESNIGFQENKRQEWSKFHTHYPNQLPPSENPNLELEFLLHTFSANIKHLRFWRKNSFTAGISSQYQNNRIDGYMFLLPDYKKYSAGIFLYNKYFPSPQLTLNGGLRFDYGTMHIAPFYSIYTNNFKSKSFKAHFYDISWAFGLSYNLHEKVNIKLNIGKSFRMPNASELSANGIHHGSFRYEVGDTNIVSEYAYQIDAGIIYNSKRLSIEVGSFASYFPNFIFLNPTGSYLHPQGYEIQEADAGQVYQYIQSKSFRIGFDYALLYQLSRQLALQTTGQYVYATDLEYPIPFTPPLALHTKFTYKIKNTYKKIINSNLTLSHQYSAAQNRNARNELSTPAYQLWNISISSTLVFLKQNITFAFQIQNLLNEKYFNHISFYRLIELPEAGRNYQITIKIPFQTTFK